MDSSNVLALSPSVHGRSATAQFDLSLTDEPVIQSGIVIHDLEFRCVGWSGLCEKLSGLRKENVLHGRGALDTTLLQALGGKLALESVVRGDTVTLPDTLIMSSDRTARWIACTHTAQYGADGQIIGVVSFLADVSAQKTALNQTQGLLAEFQDLYHNAPSGHHTADINGVFTQMNNTELRWLGYAHLEVIGHLRLSDILTSESTARFERNFKKFLAAGSIDEIEYDFVRKDGSTFPVLLTGKAKYSADGTFIGGRATVIDISEHRRVENALKLSDANLKRAQSLTQCGNYQFSTGVGENNRTFHWSPEFYRILGRDPKDGQVTTQTYITQVIHREDRVRCEQALVAALKAGRGFELDYRIVRPDGAIRYVRDLAELEFKVDDDNAEFFGVIQDVTELRKTQENLKKRERLFESLVENSYDGIALFQADGYISYVSPVASRMLGFTPEEFLGASTFDFIHSNDIDRMKKWSVQLLRAPGSQFTDELRFRTKAGNWLWVEVTNSNQLQNNDVGAIVCNFRDITQRKERAAELQASNSQLLELSRHLRTSIETERTRIARELHDDLGATLTAIKMYLGQSTANSNSMATSNPPYARALQLLDNGTESLARIVSDLRPSVLDHRGLLPAIQWLVAEFEERTGIPCEFSSSITISDDEFSDHEKTALFRICQEALHNILRHANASAAAIGIKPDGKALLIEIRDDGMGFEGRKRKGPRSWGIIGMRERAHELGGDIAVQSTKHSGSLILIRVPRRRTANHATNQVREANT
jgi:PAS domain S-box-containing protein